MTIEKWDELSHEDKNTVLGKAGGCGSCKWWNSDISIYSHMEIGCSYLHKDRILSTEVYDNGCLVLLNQKRGI
ncbi:hypothetical protein KAR91_06530 [Candidatus Pacearchaeota archaeon]|nr:hypothetical protein [Candidatus Pacearchaeota archaeon]